jgi:hypothetical protein
LERVGAIEKMCLISSVSDPDADPGLFKPKNKKFYKIITDPYGQKHTDPDPDPQHWASHIRRQNQGKIILLILVLVQMTILNKFN